MKLYVQTITGKTFAVDLDGSDTIETLREKVAEQSNIATAQQKLMYQGIVLADGRTLKDYYIQPSSTILTGDDNMIGAMQGGDTLTFYVKTSKGDKIKFKLPSSTTVYDLKEKLAKSIDIPSIEQSLSYNGAPLANENTLAYYQILPESVVKM
ncbi:hypothetical protein GUITHDRAFT_47044, partial [Guillardia theta CCMP2712]